MDQLPTMCPSGTLLATSALKSVQTTWWSMARAGTTLLTSEAIGSAVHAPMDSARASPTIGTWASASGSATGSGLEPGHGHGGVPMGGDGGTITTTIMSALITSTSTTIGIMELPLTA